MQWKKDPNLKYTDLCIYIDENMEKLRNPGEYPDVENKIWNYLWLLIKALAIKKGMFDDFQHYDPYAFYGANRIFFALRKNLQNEGKTIKGKLIRPIKSCLNYTKLLLNPMKIEYQNEAFREVINEEFVAKKFDSWSYHERLKAEAAEGQGVYEDFQRYIKESFNQSGKMIDKVLDKSPFGKNTLEYKYLKFSIILNVVAILKSKKKLDTDIQTVILWKLPKSMSSYVRVLIKEFVTELKTEIMECYKAVDIDDSVLEMLIANPYGESYNKDEND